MADSRIEELRRRIERDPGSRLFAQLAEQLRKEGELEEAIGVARAGLKRHPNYPSARLTLGRALLDSGDPAAACAELDAAVKGAPDNILASRLLGEALETLGDLGAALSHYRKTLEMAPSDRHVEARIQAIQERLGAPGAGAGEGAGAGPPAPSGPRQDLTKPMKAVRREDAPRTGAAGVAEPEEEGEGLPPTIRIRMPGDPVRGIRAPMPPAAGSTSPSGEAPPPKEAASPTRGGLPGEESTLPTRTRLSDDALPATLPRGTPPEAAKKNAAEDAEPGTLREGQGAEPAVRPTAAGGTGDARTTDGAKPAEDSDLAPTLPSSKAAEYAAIDESLPRTVPPGAVTSPTGLEEGPSPPVRERPPVSPEPSPPGREASAGVPEPQTAPIGAAAGPGRGGPTAQSVDAVAKPLSSGTLAELYFQQGLLERAVEVYREVLAAEPGNEAARARLAEIEAAAGASEPASAEEEGEGRAARRRALERTIERLEALLAIVQRR